MANPNLSEVVTTTLRNRTGSLKDNVSRNNALLARLRTKGRIKPFNGGRTITQELDYANNQTFIWYSGYQSLNINPSTVISSAEFPIRQAALAVSISGLEEIQNAGEEQVIDLLESRVENGERSFLNGLSQGIYGDGTVANSIGGMQLLLATSPSTGVIGGIDRASWVFWRNIVYSALTNGGAALSAANIISYMDSLWVQLIRGPDAPDLIVADNTAYKYYLQACQSIQRITDSSKAADLNGFQSLKYNTADVVLDGGYQGQSTDPLPFQTSSGTSAVGGAPSSTMFFANTNYLHYRPSSRRDMTPLDPDRFSVNQDALVRLLGWAGNLTISNCFLQGVLTT